jgi:TRAP-type C4-dicarboxylate transport system permease small subunit
MEAAKALATARGRPFRWARLILGNIEEIISGAALIIVVAAVVWGVLTRYVTRQPAPWSGEVAAIGFAWVVFLGAAAGVKRHLHISIDLLVVALPGPLGRALQTVIDIGLLVFMVYVVRLGIGFTNANWDNPTSVLRLPLAIVYLSVTVGFALMAIRHATDLLHRLRRGAA